MLKGEEYACTLWMRPWCEYEATTLPYENKGMTGALTIVDGLVVEVNLRM